MTEELTTFTSTATTPSRVHLAPEAQFHALVDRLKNSETASRVQAAKELGLHGAPAVGPLCEALKDTEHGVRKAAAESLREVGDETAVGPLVEALRAGFPGKSPRRSRIMTTVFLILIPLFLIAALAMVIATKGEGLGDLVSNLHFLHTPPPKMTDDRRAFIRALAEIAERSPTPELRKVLADLRDIAADTLQQDVKTRAASRAAAWKIDKLTAKLDQLPVMAAAPKPETAQLPVIDGER